MVRARVGLLGMTLALATGCELLTGISEKNLTSGSTGVPCSQQGTYIFCDDFDTSGETFGQTWDWHTGQGGGSLDFDTTVYATAPRSAVFSGPSSALSSAQLGKHGLMLQASMRVAFDLRVDVDAAASLPELSVVQVLTTTTGLSLNYVLGPGAIASLQIFDAAGSAPLTEIMLAPPPVRQWTHIVLSSDWKSFTAEEDGKMLGTTASPRTGAPGALSVIAGLVYVNQSMGGAPATLEIDDFVIGGS